MTRLDIIVSKWGIRFAGRFFPASIGKCGISSSKREGDTVTPAGTHKIIGILYRPDRIVKPCNWAVKIKPFDIWSDDVDDPDYNMMSKLPHKYGHEMLSRPDPLYDIVVLTNWNWPYPIRGNGSAIFMHIWRKPRHPTEGCIGMSRRDLVWVIKRLEPQSRIIIND